MFLHTTAEEQKGVICGKDSMKTLLIAMGGGASAAFIRGAALH